MAEYIATFFTHYDAMQFKRQLEKAGAEGTMCPVPRWLSSSCGTCVRFSFSCERIGELQGSEMERLVQVSEDQQYQDIIDNR